MKAGGSTRRMTVFTSLIFRAENQIKQFELDIKELDEAAVRAVYNTCQTFNNNKVVIGTFLTLVNHTVAITKPQFNKKMHYYYSNYSIDPQRLMETATSILWLHP